MEMNLDTTRKIQNSIYARDVYEPILRQNFFYFLGNHPTLFQEFVEPGFMTIAEMNYICEHFYDYDVDPRTFENDFKRAMREALPRYNHMKSIELIEDVFDLTDDKYTREIVSARATHLAQNGNKTTNGTNTSNNGVKEASRAMPMESTQSATLDGIVSWNRGASTIGESKATGSSTINQTDANALLSDGTEIL